MDGDWADPLRGVFGPDEFVNASRAYEIEASVVVQAVTDVDETRELLMLAAETPQIAGVIGWIDLTAANVTDQLAALREGPGGETLVGVRHQVEDEPDPAWLLRDDVHRGLRAISDAGLTYDLLVRPPQIACAVETVRRRPEVSFVLDHLGKPQIGEDMTAWASAMAELADHPNAVAKISGLVTEADWRTWSPAQLLPYIEHALAVFGPDRLMFGSDWPVCRLAATYGQVVSIVDTALTAWTHEERQAILARTATRVYGLPDAAIR